MTSHSSCSSVRRYTRHLHMFLASKIVRPVRAESINDKEKLVDFAMVVLEQLRLNPRAFVDHEAHVELDGWLEPHNGLPRGEPVAPGEMFAYLKGNLQTISQEVADTFRPPSLVSPRDRAFGSLCAFKLRTATCSPNARATRWSSTRRGSKRSRWYA